MLLTWTNPFYFFNGWDLNDRMKCVLYWNGLSPIHFSLKRGTIDFLYLTKTFKIQNSHSFLTRSLIYGHFFLCMHRLVYITPHPPYFRWFFLHLMLCPLLYFIARKGITKKALVSAIYLVLNEICSFPATIWDVINLIPIYLYSCQEYFGLGCITCQKYVLHWR